MSFLIYLDQNTLSNLRQRKLKESKNELFELLKYVLGTEQVTVVYSHVTLDEILQISRTEYQQEHLDVLIELQAKYIEPLNRSLSSQSPEVVWRAHIDNKQSNIDLGITNLMEVSQLSSRKLSGLPIDESFADINEKVKSSLDTLLSNCENQLASIDIESLDEPFKSYFSNMQGQMDQLRVKAATLQAPAIASDQQLGPQPFRDIPEVKALELKALNVDSVVSAIEATFKVENSNFNLADYFEDTPQTAVARAYSLMNWAGYYADDFTKSKKGKDRFNASHNDMQHAVSALGASFLISDDKNFVKKAKACYAYVGSSTVVCEPKGFIDQYCKFV
ncbi:Uncharacterised protein [Vibrio owensii]|uniref:hypothetical protein n=1 Tax=Gammaproteobacteria TaxID=1236 RepID=UPI0003A99B0A|nr:MULTISPECIES: hypothetical protein [Gammaproteobacteria]EGR1894289.1 hypothetical protein [Vibrio vulnificus]MDF4896928.1 hypothetical protein [Vibrio parahaemolyticus]GHB05186.1 hypothetical protein GCM10007107_17730 [Shewanella indica]SUQ02022.1 Uncharacterised protein [Vibrio owensii]